MNGIIQPKVINSLLINNELGDNFITHYSSAPIYGKYGDLNFSAPTHLPINFNLNGYSQSILPNYLYNDLKLKFITGEIDPELFKNISQLLFENPELYIELKDNNFFNNEPLNKNGYNFNLSSNGIANEDSFFPNQIILAIIIIQ